MHLIITVAVILDEALDRLNRFSYMDEQIFRNIVQIERNRNITKKSVTAFSQSVSLLVSQRFFPTNRLVSERLVRRNC